MTESPAPIHWSAILPSRGPDTTKEHLAAHFAAMALAHSDAYREAITARGQTLEKLRSATDAHFHPMLAAFTAAAALHGWEPQQIDGAVEDGADVSEWCWQWLTEAGVSESDIKRITWSSNAPEAILGGGVAR